jgi:hypothetical protein
MRFEVNWTRALLGPEKGATRPVRQKPPPNPVARARELQRALAVEGSDADVARAFGVTRAGVCQYLTVLRRLPADLLDRVEAEQEPARLKEVSLRKLLGVAKIERAGDRRLRLRALVKRAGR